MLPVRHDAHCLVVVVAVVCVVCATVWVCRARGGHLARDGWSAGTSSSASCVVCHPALVRGLGHPLTPLRSQHIGVIVCSRCAVSGQARIPCLWGRRVLQHLQMPLSSCLGRTYLCLSVFALDSCLCRPVNRCAAQSASSPCQQCMHTPPVWQPVLLPGVYPLQLPPALWGKRTVFCHRSPLALSHAADAFLFVYHQATQHVWCPLPSQCRVVHVCVWVCVCLCVCWLCFMAWQQAHWVWQWALCTTARVLRCCGGEAWGCVVSVDCKRDDGAHMLSRHGPGIGSRLLPYKGGRTRRRLSMCPACCASHASKEWPWSMVPS